jgi:hypothetical protein
LTVSCCIKPPYRRSFENLKCMLAELNEACNFYLTRINATLEAKSVPNLSNVLNLYYIKRSWKEDAYRE